MTFNVPIETTLESTSIVDSAELWNNTVRQNYAAGYEIKYIDSVYINATGDTIFIPEYDSAASYAIGDIAFKDGYISMLASTGSHEDPAQPQNYAAGYDTSASRYDWTHRYVRMADYSAWDDGMTLSYDTTTGTTVTHYVYPSASSTTGFFYRTEATDYYGHVITSITKEVHVLTSITNSTLEYRAERLECCEGYAWAGRTLILNLTGIYIRTDESVAAEYVTVTEDLWIVIDDPRDLGFVYSRISEEYSPFDEKQYTSVIRASTQTWTVRATRKFNCIAISRLRGASLDITFRDSGGTEISAVSAKTIYDTVDENIEAIPTTDIVYAGSWIDAGGTVEISVNSTGDETEVGYIFAAAAIYVGVTDLQFSHKIVNFDRSAQSEVSGYIDYIPGNRIIVYTGKFRMPMTDYSKMVMINKKMTQELIAVDGSDMTDNAEEDGKNTFRSMKIVCRIKKLEQSSNVTDGEMDITVPIEFEFREVV